MVETPKGIREGDWVKWKGRGPWRVIRIEQEREGKYLCLVEMQPGWETWCIEEQLERVAPPGLVPEWRFSWLGALYGVVGLVLILARGESLGWLIGGAWFIIVGAYAVVKGR